MFFCIFWWEEVFLGEAGSFHGQTCHSFCSERLMASIWDNWVDCQTLKLPGQGTLQTDHFKIVHRSQKTIKIMTIQLSIPETVVSVSKMRKILFHLLGSPLSAVHPILETVSPRDKGYCFTEVMDCDSDILMGHQCYNLKFNSLARLSVATTLSHNPVETLLCIFSGTQLTTWLAMLPR